MGKEAVLITGGTKGIGRAAAEALLASPKVGSVWLTFARDRENAERCAEELQSFGKEVHISELDITDPQAPKQLKAEMEAEAFLPSYLLFNANITDRTPLEELSETAWARVFQANIHFPTFLIQELLPAMVPGGLIAFTGSLMGIHPHSVSLAYGVTKSAVHALILNLVKHLEPYQHRVVGIAPGFVDTEWQKTKPQQIRTNIENKIALHRFAEPEEVGAVFRTILENKYFNGDIITLSGGYSYR
ncbi:MAG: SDR family oxidoreductase [Porphyromonas sp.]|nr:SDR family oxidoreductase [Porphyromonas sp.]